MSDSRPNVLLQILPDCVSITYACRLPAAIYHPLPIPYGTLQSLARSFIRTRRWTHGNIVQFVQRVGRRGS